MHPNDIEREREVWARVTQREPESTGERMLQRLQKERCRQRETLLLAGQIGRPDAVALRELAREQFERETSLRALYYLRTGKQATVSPCTPLTVQTMDILTFLRRLYEGECAAAEDCARLSADDARRRERYRALQESAKNGAQMLARMISERL